MAKTENDEIAIADEVVMNQIFVARGQKVMLEIAEIKNTVEKIGKKQSGQDKYIELIFEYIDRLQEKAEQPVLERKAIGFKMGGGKDSFRMDKSQRLPRGFSVTKNS